MAGKGKKKEEAPKGDLESSLLAVNKQYGEDIAIKASCYPVVRRYITGIFGLDFITGGGLPRRRTSKFSGWQSTGKTTTSQRVITSVQRHCAQCAYLVCGCDNRTIPKTVYMDVEGALDRDWGRDLGWILDHVYIVQANYAEQAIDVCDMALRSGDCDFLVVDSLAALVPMAEIEESVEKQQQGLAARLINKALRKFTASLNIGGPTEKRGGTILLINQLRHKIGVMFGNPEVEPGGFGQQYVTSINIRTSKGDYGKDKDDEQVTWQGIKLRAVKNKTAPARGVWEYKVWCRDYKDKKKGETDEIEQILKAAQDNGLLVDRVKSGTKSSREFVWLNEDGGQIYPDLAAPSKPKFVELLQSYPLRADLQGDATYWDLFRAEVLRYMMGADAMIPIVNPVHDDPGKETLKIDALA